MSQLCSVRELEWKFFFASWAPQHIFQAARNSFGFIDLRRICYLEASQSSFGRKRKNCHKDIHRDQNFFKLRTSKFLDIS